MQVQVCGALVTYSEYNQHSLSISCQVGKEGTRDEMARGKMRTCRRAKGLSTDQKVVDRDCGPWAK